MTASPDPGDAAGSADVGDAVAAGAVAAGAAAAGAAAAGDAVDSDADTDTHRARQLFRYLVGEEWHEYRRILKVFAGTFFAEFTPDEISAKALIDPGTAHDRLESLRRWGNLTVSSSVGNPTSLDDYRSRRNRYLITRSGQEVFELVESVLARNHEIGDVEAGRLRELLRALQTVAARLDAVGAGSGAADETLNDAVRTVFDVHERFTTEVTNFFAELNEWQSRYDLDPEEVQFFAGVLVDYVSEQLFEIERMTPQVSRILQRIMPRLDDLLPSLRSGLAARVDDAGLADSVTVRRQQGSEAEHWKHLAAWFVGAAGRPSRLDALTRQALGAVRTLTANVSRLSRLGAGAASRRSDFIRLAGFFDRALGVDEAHDLAAGAFGLGSCRRLGTLASDADDSAATNTPWSEAPRAEVPVSLRERGDTAQRGAATPIRDRRRERELLTRRRERERVERQAVATELLSAAGECGRIDGAVLSEPAFVELRDLIGRSGHRAMPGEPRRRIEENGVRCEVFRTPGTDTIVECPQGRFAMRDLLVSVTPASATGRDVPNAVDSAASRSGERA